VLPPNVIRPVVLLRGPESDASPAKTAPKPSQSPR
jgi:hypothetical protein